MLSIDEYLWQSICDVGRLRFLESPLEQVSFFVGAGCISRGRIEVWSREEALKSFEVEENIYSKDR